MAKSLGLAEIPTLNPNQEEPSRFDRAILRVINDNFRLVQSAVSRIYSILKIVENMKAATVATSQTTTSSSYVDLATLGPSVTCETGTSALVFLQSFVSNNTGGAFVALSVAVSGATTLAASDDNGIFWQVSDNNAQLQFGGYTIITGLTPGNNTFTMKYRVAGGGTGTWQRRKIAVIPLP